jgi:hypothetical protein
MKRLYAVLIGLTCLVMTAGTVAAADKLPAKYPEYFHDAGAIDGVDMESGIVIINDRARPISMNVRVHTPSTQFGSYRSLKKGQTVGFHVTAGAGTIDEIWVLPKGYTPTLRRGGAGH